MPRPPLKRRRSNKQSPNRAGRAPSNAGLSSTPRVKLQQQLADKVVGQKPQDSDDSDRLVTRTRHGRSRRNVEQIFASGGVAKGDKPGTFPTKQERMQRLRSETSEIIRRSRSKSVEGTGRDISKSRSTSLTNTKADASRVLVPASQPLSNDSPESAIPQPQPTPMAETSILGTLKPRRRQASILHMIDNVDSSIINPEDEEQFLPDDESTPLNSRKAAGDKGSTRTPANLSTSTSRKRKLGSDEPVAVANANLVASSSPLSEAITPDSDQLPDNIPSQKHPLIYDDDDIMAPPQSSSPEPSPQPSKHPLTNKSKPKPAALTTEQLQSHMPSKRRKGTRQRNVRSEFDIPDDSDSDGVNQDEDGSAFLPQKRTPKSRNVGRKETARSKASAKSKVSSKSTRAAVGTPMAKSKQTSKSTSTPVTVVTPRTPLPLTRNLNQENKSMSLARDRDRSQPSKPNGGGKDITPATTRNQKITDKQSGGSRPRRILRSGIHTGAESDKENSTAGRTRSSRKRTLPAEPDVDDIQPSIEADEALDDMEEEPEVDQGVGLDGEADRVSNSISVDLGVDDGGSADARAWKNKWGDIDNWNLDYEEVSLSTGSSSPLRASAV